ncbi:hypothetical protein L7F22_033611 [Adiantum nelumboides]|nr:hypothetical protein [Adiantum nelumboides]
MATRNRTPIFRKYRDALRQVRLSSPSGQPSSSSLSGGPVIEMATAPFLNQKAGYNPISTIDMDHPGSGTLISWNLAKELGLKNEDKDTSVDSFQTLKAHDGDTTKTIVPYIRKLKFELQGFKDKDSFCMADLEWEEVILGVPWNQKVYSVVYSMKKVVEFTHKGKKYEIQVGVSGYTIQMLVYAAGKKNVVADASSREPHVAAVSIAYQHELDEMRDHYSTIDDFAEPYDAFVRGKHPDSYTLKDGFLRAGAVAISLPPQWVDISEDVSNNMQQARVKMNELVKAHAKALRPTFGDNKDEHRAIELLTHEITLLLKKCEKSLQQLSTGKGPNEDATLRKNVQRSLATNLQSLSMEFRKEQKGYLDRLRRQQDIPTAAELGMNLNEHRTSSLEDDDDLGFGKQRSSQMKRVEKMTLEREKEISQIVESVNDLAQIMKDLSVLVIDQGTIVDRIDYNLQNVSSSVEQGVKQLERAEKTQKKGGMVMCVMILICLCLFMIFVLMIKWLVL